MAAMTKMTVWTMATVYLTNINCYYNIASRAAQSNSLYVSVLKIPIVHANRVSKSLR